MVQYIFLYGVARNILNDNDCCSIRSAKAPGMKLAINDHKNIPTLSVTWDLYDYVLGDAVKICNDKKFIEIVQKLDSFAVGFSRKIIQVKINGKSKPVDAFAYFANDMKAYKEIDDHSYNEWFEEMIKKSDADYEIVDKV